MKSKMTWDYEKQVAETTILPHLAKMPKDKDVKVYVETDAVFLNVRIENEAGFVFQERHNHPDEAIAMSNGLKSYFEENGNPVKRTEYGFFVILRP